MVCCGVHTTALFILAGLECLLFSQALHCRPCYTKAVSVFNHSNIPLGNGLLMHTQGCHITHKKGGDPCYTWIGQGEGVGINFNYTGAGHEHVANLVTLAACLIHAVELKETGFHPHFFNVSGHLAVCVNFTEYVSHVQNKTWQEALRLRPAHFLSPSVVKWGTVITLVLAILLAI
uniref:GP4 n=1 Tax=Lactate dehydrogenase-elevating virus TaxID=11048 RepID=A0A2S0SZ72_LDV|nr:GP4 [Lactate dehydrogenase-elevating virus]